MAKLTMQDLKAMEKEKGYIKVGITIKGYTLFGYIFWNEPKQQFTTKDTGVFDHGLMTRTCTTKNVINYLNKNGGYLWD